MSFECKYDLQEDLGKGMFGVVKKCRDKETGQVFAAKIVRKTKKTTEDVLREISMMKLLKHEGLAQIYESFETQRQIIIVMEFIPGKELFAKVTEDEVFSEKTAVMYLKQILLGIQHMHGKYIVHLDIKPENIICKPGIQPGTEDVKLIDFGLAREVKPGNNVTVLCGTPEFVAPEVLSYDPISLASDMWSIGVITYVLLSGISPFLGDNDAETLGYVTCGDYDFDNHAEVFDNVSEDAKSFIEQLLEVKPRDRNTVNECLCHSWITTGGHENLLTTSNLKTFNAKRKWQKTLNAVRAVGRFAFLNRVKNLKSSLSDPPAKEEEIVKPQNDESTNNEYLHLPADETSTSTVTEDSPKETSTSTVPEDPPKETSTSTVSEDPPKETSTSTVPEDPPKKIITCTVPEDTPEETYTSTVPEDTPKETSTEVQSSTQELTPFATSCYTTSTSTKVSEGTFDDQLSSPFVNDSETCKSSTVVESIGSSDFAITLSSRLRQLSDRTFDLDEDFRQRDQQQRRHLKCSDPFEQSSDEEYINIMESNNNEVYSNHNGGDDMNGEDEEAKDDISPLESNGSIENGEDPDSKVAFKNWYRRASTSKTLTAVQQKSLERGLENDIPIFGNDSHNGSASPKLASNGSTPKQQQPMSEEEQKVLDAISRRLSIQTTNDSISGGKNDPKAAKPKLGNIRRGSVPQARLLKGNVKNRLAAFENK